MDKDTFDLESLREDYDLELKLAEGEDGKGKLPNSFWETYSAMANTEGGYVILGAEETNTGYSFKGLQNPDKVVKELWNGANNREKVSENILNNPDVKVKEHDGVNLVIVHIPQAGRKQRPVFINNNPLRGTYRRNNEGDYRCPEHIVKQMLGEQTNDTRDAVIFEKYGMSDIDAETLKIYRQHFSNRKPDHPFNDCNDLEFLRQIGGYSIDRTTKKEGLTLAGLLMFGKLRSILDAVPNYIVDYQRQPREASESRWLERITTDFTWSGNIYDFYRTVIKKLFENLKTPFKLKGDERIEETPVHEALREAFVNTLVHADYSGNCSILVIEKPGLFSFRNPGLLRLPKEEVLRGGVSDCRNRNMQKIFQLIGMGEQAGSGFPKIYKNWRSQDWKLPDLEERIESNQTVLEMRMESLLPEGIVSDLSKRLGRKFKSLSQIERIALVTAEAETCITHHRLMEITSEHPSELSAYLHKLVEAKLLQSDGAGKGTFYFAPGKHPICKKGSEHLLLRSEHYMENFKHKSSEHKDGKMSSSSEHLPGRSEHKSSEHLGSSSEHYANNYERKDRYTEEEKGLILSVKMAGKAPKEKVRQVIMLLCREQWFSLVQLASTLNRDKDSMRNHYVMPMVDEGVLMQKIPNIRNHPYQQYKLKNKAK